LVVAHSGRFATTWREPVADIGLNMGPVFIFGTGRCGSTHLQRLISLNTEVWIWGEHNGFLAPMLDSISRFEDSVELRQQVFDASPAPDDAALVARMTGGSRLLSWLNRFDRTTVRDELRVMIDRLFRTPLPQGWSQWGFKEILYGLHNDAPALLLQLFPLSTAAFSFRHPKATIESMLRSWDTAILNDSNKMDKLEERFAERASRWETLTNYHLELKAVAGRRMVFVSLEDLVTRPPAIFRALDLPLRPGSGLRSPSITRWGQTAMPPRAQPLIDKLYAHRRERLEDLYSQAMDIAASDLAASTSPAVAHPD